MNFKSSFFHLQITNLFAIFSVFLFIYFDLVLNSDIYLWFDITKKILDNNYILYKDIFEINFPGIMIFNILPFYLEKYLNIDMIVTYFIENILILMLSIYLIYKMNQKYLFIPYYWFSLFGVISLIMAGSEFAQRDTLVFYLTIPYLWIRFFQDKYPDNPPINIYRVLSAILISIGFVIKPQFALVLIITELYFLIKNKKSYILFTIENILILISGILYLLILYSIFNEFFIYIFPELSTYLNGMESYEPPYILFIPLVLFGLLFLYEKQEKLLLIYFIAFTIVLFIQSKYFLYHFIPLYSIILMILFLKVPKLDKSIRIILISICSLFFIFKIYLLVSLKQCSDEQENYIYKHISKNTFIIDTIGKKTQLAYNNKIKDFVSSSSTFFLTNPFVGDKENYNLYQMNKKLIIKDINEHPDYFILIPKNTYNILQQEYLKEYKIIKEFKNKQEKTACSSNRDFYYLRKK